MYTDRIDIGWSLRSGWASGVSANTSGSGSVKMPLAANARSARHSDRSCAPTSAASSATGRGPSTSRSATPRSLTARTVIGTIRSVSSASRITDARSICGRCRTPVRSATAPTLHELDQVQPDQPVPYPGVISPIWSSARPTREKMACR